MEENLERQSLADLTRPYGGYRKVDVLEGPGKGYLSEKLAVGLARMHALYRSMAYSEGQREAEGLPSEGVSGWQADLYASFRYTMLTYLVLHEFEPESEAAYDQMLELPTQKFLALLAVGSHGTVSASGAEGKTYGDGWYDTLELAGYAADACVELGAYDLHLFGNEHGSWGFLYRADTEIFPTHHLDLHPEMRPLAVFWGYEA